MSTSSERLLISSIIRDQDIDVAVKHGVDTPMFHAYADEWTWLSNYFQRHRKAPTRAAFKSAFPEFVIKRANDTGYFADEVRKSHARFELTSTMRDAAEFIADGNIETAILKIQKSVVTIAAGMGTQIDTDILRDFDDIMQEVADRKARYDANGSAGIPTGFPSLDERTGGPQPGELWVMGARQGEGKSWTMQRWAAAAVLNGYTVQFDALEQSRASVAMRIYSMLSGKIGRAVFNASGLMQGHNYDPMMFKKFVKSLNTEVKGRLHVSDASRGRVSTLTCASQIERNKPDILFIDYITLMARTSPDWMGTAQLSSDISSLAVEYGIPIVAASQLNRTDGITRGKGQWNPPGTEALAQADAIGNDATAVVTMSAPSQSVRVFYGAKMRNNESGFKFYTHFDPGHGIFEEVSYDKAQNVADDDADRADAAKERMRRGR